MIHLEFLVFDILALNHSTMNIMKAMISHGIVALFILYLGIRCFGQVELDAAPMEKREKEALYSTIQGFVGNWWNGSDLYPDPCGWTPIQGVSCDLFNGFWYVTSLSIGPVQENSLSCAQIAEFRQQLFEFKHLKALSFFNCFLSGHNHPVTIPSGNWEKLSGSLESLEFRSNLGLVGKIPTGFGVLKNLQSLVLLENGLTGEIPAHIGNLTKLKRLVLAGNSFSGQIPDIFSGLTELLILDLSRNSLSGPLPFTLGSLTALLKLDVSNNHLEGNLLRQFAYLKNVTLMDLRNNRFSGGLVLSIQEMHSLEEMALSHNPIEGSIRDLKWENLQNLTILELSNMGLTGEIPGSICELKRLRFLGLSNNSLTGNISPKLATLPFLSALYVSVNNLTGVLNFSEQFYGKMGRRFGAWDNPNLCYPVGEISRSHVPFGVKPCQKEVRLLEIDTETKMLNGDMNQTSHFMASLGFSRYATNGFWCAFLVESWMMALFLTSHIAL